MRILNAKKGFTLIELLAVIVILAILILLAMPAVLNMMQKAQKNAFVLEANEIVNLAQGAYSEQSITGDWTGSINLAGLSTGGYSKKDFTATANNKYAGCISVDVSTTPPTIKVWFTNGTYYIENLDANAVSALNANSTETEGLKTSGASNATLDGCGTP